MGLMDFFKKGTEKPAQPKQQPAPGGLFDKSNVASPAGQPQPQPQQDTYTVKSGDSLSKIARNYYGDAMKWTKIYDANKDVIGNNPDMIHPGQTLKIPKQP